MESKVLCLSTGNHNQTHQKCSYVTIFCPWKMTVQWNQNIPRISCPVSAHPPTFLLVTWKVLKRQNSAGKWKRPENCKPSTIWALFPRFLYEASRNLSLIKQGVQSSWVPKDPLPWGTRCFPAKARMLETPQLFHKKNTILFSTKEW